ncbi:uncharacterized protein N7446_006325 [Penicillium canescens]|uniref:uncharacterized protein n=1 Tax=Penicillium canescens TaxID=5083 RepID=UPI0026DF9138|nr:uncharacterized protein N7446_006325 [Penicillium canescens]KAJ6062205.1 hypothetical protein N7446_006325 [Penicillium canescens]
MPRTLPWLRAQDGTPVKNESTPRKRVKTEATPDRDVTPKNPQSPPKSATSLGHVRFALVIYMFLLDGIERDDGWVMVEDEFYAVAQTFTQHLHYAEYLRRRKEVKAENAAALGVIERPTDGRTPVSKEAERQREREAFRQRQKAGLARLDGQNPDEQIDDHEEDDQRWTGTHLHDLMTSPRKARSLAGTHVLKSSSRAAAGFLQAGQVPPPGNGQAQVNSTGSATPISRAAAAQVVELDEETASDSDDDLDIQHEAVRLPPPRSAHSMPRKLQSDDQNIPRANLRNSTTSRSKVKAANTRPEYKSRVQSLFDDLDELPEPSPSIISTSNNITKSPSTRQEKSRHNEVPTFLV